MTKQEAISMTEYSENELINIALQFAINAMNGEIHDEETQNHYEEWEHYYNLRRAFHAILDERILDERKEKEG